MGPCACRALALNNPAVLLLAHASLSASGGSISKVGVFSLGIVPYINASILFQLLATAFPSLKKLQREEGPQGRARFQQYQKLAALAFAVAQAAGQLTYLRPYVDDFSAGWLAENVVLLTAGAMILVYVSCAPGAGGWGGWGGVGGGGGGALPGGAREAGGGGRGNWPAALGQTRAACSTGRRRQTRFPCTASRRWRTPSQS